jgi:hypothetical protein
MEPAAEPLSFYGAPADHPLLDWSWVDEQLQSAGTFWVVGAGPGAPHPRPVWGVWHDRRLLLSIGSPQLRAQLAAGSAVTVHLDSGIEVVVVEGRVHGGTDEPGALAAYDAKYDWQYDVAQYGPLTDVRPRRVLAWRSAGPAGRDGFVASGRWRFG